MSKQVKSTISDVLFTAIEEAAENSSLSVSNLIASVLASHFGKPAQDSAWGGQRIRYTLWVKEHGMDWEKKGFFSLEDAVNWVLNDPEVGEYEQVVTADDDDLLNADPEIVEMLIKYADNDDDDETDFSARRIIESRERRKAYAKRLAELPAEIQALNPHIKETQAPELTDWRVLESTATPANTSNVQISERVYEAHGYIVRHWRKRGWTGSRNHNEDGYTVYI